MLSSFFLYSIKGRHCYFSRKHQNIKKKRNTTFAEENFVSISYSLFPSSKLYLSIFQLNLINHCSASSSSIVFFFFHLFQVVFLKSLIIFIPRIEEIRVHTRMELLPGLPDDVGLECLIRISYEYFSSVASVCRGWKNEIELPEFWQHRKAANLTGKVVVIAQAEVDLGQELGTKKCLDVPVYRLTLCEPETGYWTQLPAIPGYSDGLPMFCQLVGVGLNLVVMGGWNPTTWEVSNSVFIYNFVSARWRSGADMPGCRRSFFACASDSSRFVFVAGGHDGDKCALKSSMAYDVTQDKWILLPDMARERDESRGIFHLGQFHVIGGYHTNTQGRFDASAEAFDVVTWQWGVVQEDFLNTAICPRNCVDNGNGKLFVFSDTYVVTLQESRWQVVAELPIRNTIFVTAWLDKLLVIGTTRFGAPPETFVLDLKSKKWERIEAPDGFSGHVQFGCCLEL